MRGAANRIFALSTAEASRCVVTSSTGNHGLGVMAAARERGIDLEVFISPQVSPKRRHAMEAYGARLNVVGSKSGLARARAESYRVDGFEIEVAESPNALAEHCRLIVTTTCSRQWLLGASDIRPGTHITAVGADGGGKQELEPELFRVAAVRAVDSRVQCAAYGDSSYAIRQHLISGDLVELGEVIAGTRSGRQDFSQITIADLTGVAVQDIQIARLAVESLAGAV